MQAFELDRLIAKAERASDRYHEFLRVPSMSLGIYRLPKGAVDLQTPHRQDEAYYVLRGRASFRVESESRTVAPGDLLFVPAAAEHKFYDIEEDLLLLVLFAPAEG